MTNYLFRHRDDAVQDAVEGLARLHPDTIAINHDPLYVTARTPHPDRRVGLVSGGGSGHEPLHSGFVGAGALDAAVPGDIFASPHNRQVYEASRAIAGRDGVLHIVKNYTGDRINFGIAAERLQNDGIPVARVLVDDDLATGAAGTATGRRGTGGTVILEKLLGAAADDGLDLDTLVQLGNDIVGRTRSLAAAWRPHTSPSTGEPAFDITDGEIEFGVGIHGERATSIPETNSGDVILRMTDQLIDSLDDLDAGAILLVNGLGSVTLLELSGVFNIVAEHLEKKNVPLRGAMVGTLIPALDMRGLSLTLTAARPEWLDWWTRPTGAPGFPPTSALTTIARPTNATPHAADQIDRDWSDPVLAAFETTATAAYATLTAWDQASGDGDFGDNLTRGLAAARRAETETSQGFAAAARTFLDDVGGSSGPLLGLLFESIATALNSAVTDADREAAYATGIRDGLTAIQRVGEAQPGDRTMVDALHPAVESITAGGTLQDAALAAISGARATAQLTARRGRASYVGERAIGTPDPGAAGIAILLTAIADTTNSTNPTSSTATAELEGFLRDQTFNPAS